MGVPYEYPLYNELMTVVTPSSVHVHDSALSRFFQRYLLQKAISIFEFDGMPDWWAKDYMLYVLFCRGFVGYLYTDNFGTLPQMCQPFGYDMFYRPDQAVFASPWINTERKLWYGEGNFDQTTMSVLVKLQPDYMGIMDAVAFYADMMALCAESAGVNVLNSKLAFVFGTDNKAGAEAMKKLYDKVATGEPAVVYDKSLQQAAEEGRDFWQVFAQDLRANFIAPDILANMIAWEHDFDKLVGIPFVEQEKKERLISAEVERNSVSTSVRSEKWLESVQAGIALVNKAFGLNITVKRRFDELEREEVQPDEDRDINDQGPVDR